MKFIHFLLATTIVILSVIPCRAADQVSHADYVRATLPYDTACLLSALRFAHQGTQGNSNCIGSLEQNLLEDLLRLKISLEDPSISDADKKYARDVMPKVLAYARIHDIAKGYKSGKVYEMLPDDIVLPNTMKIRDIYEQIIAVSSKSP
jgi:hypothetical protein